MELTKEYFDQGIARILDKVVTKEDFESGMSGLENRIGSLENRIGGLETCVIGIESRVGNIESTMATKEGLKIQTAELKDYTHQAFEAQQVWMGHRFDELIVQYDVRERVTVLESEVRILKLTHNI